MPAMDKRHLANYGVFGIICMIVLNHFGCKDRDDYLDITNESASKCAGNFSL